MLHSTLQKVTKQTKKVCHRYLVFLLQSYRWNRLSSLCLSFLKRSIDLARIQGRISVNLVHRILFPSTSYTGSYLRQPRTQDLISVNLVPRILSPSTSYPGSYLRQPRTQDIISVNLVPRILSPSTSYPGFYTRLKKLGTRSKERLLLVYNSQSEAIWDFIISQPERIFLRCIFSQKCILGYIYIYLFIK